MITLCEINSAVECLPSKQNVSGSNPLFRFPLWDNLFHNSSAVESVTVNHLVPGSNPGCGVSQRLL